MNYKINTSIISSFISCFSYNTSAHQILFMEKPIARRGIRYPRDFISNVSKLTQHTNLYTFNQASSLEESAIINQKQLLSNNEVNHVQFQELRIKKQVPNLNRRIYFDAESSKKQDIQQIQSQPNPQSKMKSSLSGIIVKQKVQNNPLSVQKQHQIRTPQKQFNRLALSLMGIKRTKFNRSSLEKRPSFSVHQMASPKRISMTKQKQSQRYHKQEGQNDIYEHTYYPFRAKKIQHLKNQINKISNNSRLRRNFVQQPQIPDPVSELDNNQYEYNPSREEILEEIQYKAKLEIKISIKTSLSSLKNLLSIDLSTKRLNIELPTFFLKPPSQLSKFHNFDPQTLNNQCSHIFTGLDIPINGINIRKYSNCIVIINHSICIVWHGGKNGKKYIGSWKNKYFDEGDKEGLGLEWSPGRYIYYGEFKENKRNGFGLMRKSDHSVILGYWRNGKHAQFGIQKNYAY